METFLRFVFVALFLVSFNMEVSCENATADGQSREPRAIDNGLKPVYTMANWFLGIVRPTDPKHLNDTIALVQSVMSGNVGFIANDIAGFLNKYIGFSVCVAVGLLFIVIMPIAGFIVCCCRCCCKKCGGHDQEMDGKHAKCQRVTCGILLAVITTLMLGGMVCAFLTNELIFSQTKKDKSTEEQLYSALGIIETEFSALDRYINNTVNEVQQATLKPFNDTVDKIVTMLSNAGDDAQSYVGELTQATSLLKSASDLASRVSKLADDLETMNTSINDLESSSDALQTNLTNVKNTITATLNGDTKCNGPPWKDACDNIRADLNNLQVGADFEMTDVVTAIDDALKRIKEVQDQNITGLVQQAEVEYDKINGAVKTEIDSGIEETKKEASKIYAQVDELVKSVKQSVQGVQFGKMATDITSQVNPAIQTFGPYVWYAGIGLSCVLLLVVLFYYMGLVVGACGSRPEDGSSCHKGVGANFLMAGVGFSFIFSWLLMLVTMVIFLGGGLVYTEVCRPLVDPQQRVEVAGIVDTLIPKTGSVSISVSSALSQCENDASAYNAFGLSSIINLDQYLDVDKYNLTSAIDVNKITIPKIDILTPELRNQLNSLGNSSLDSINITAILDEAKQQITKIDLNKFADDLVNFTLVTGINLNASATQLRNIQKTDVTSMTAKVDNLDAATKRVEKSLDIKNETTNLINGIEAAEISVNNNGTAYVKEKVQNTTEDVVTLLKQFASGLKGEIENRIGKCKTVYTGLNNMIDGVCVYFLNPINGFWYCFGWCLFFFLPSIILALNLVGLYRRTEKYDPSRYGGYGYDDYEGIHPGDTIPLEPIDHQKSNGVGRGGNHNGGYDARVDYPSSKPYSYGQPQHPNGYGDGMPRGGYEYGRGPGPDHYAQRQPDPSLNHGHGYPGGGPPSYRAPDPPQYHSNRNQYGGHRW